MEHKLNIAAILKDKPQGTKLYNLLYNINVELDTIITTGTKTIVWCTDKIGNTDVCHRFYSEFGTIEGYPDGLQILLPSKNMRDWGKFTWKKGDVLTNSSGFQIFFDKWANEDYTKFLGKIKLLGDSHCYDTAYYTLASEEEALEFIKNVEEINNGKLNRETLEIEELEKKPKFKDGDIVVAEEDNYYDRVIFIAAIKDDIVSKALINVRYEDYEVNYNEYRFGRNRNLRLATDSEKKQLFSALTKEGKAWDAEKKEVVEIKKEHQFKPFEKVLVRDSYESKWRASFFSNIGESYEKYVTTGLVWKFCIPYEGNEHLLGTTNNVEE